MSNLAVSIVDCWYCRESLVAYISLAGGFWFFFFFLGVIDVVAFIDTAVLC